MIFKIRIILLITTLCSTLQALFQILLVVPIIFSRAKENPMLHLAFSCHVSLVSCIHLKQFLRQLVCFKMCASNFEECISPCICLMFPHEERVTYLAGALLKWSYVPSEFFQETHDADCFCIWWCCLWSLD